MRTPKWACVPTSRSEQHRETQPLVVTVVVAAAALVMSSGIAGAVDLTCTSIQFGGTYNNVVVPINAACSLDGVHVTGNVTVNPGGSLDVGTITGDTLIAGNVSTKGVGCDHVDLEATGATGRVVVGGNVTIQNCVGSSFSGGRGSSFNTPPLSFLVGGNFKCSNNAANCVSDYAGVGGNLEFSGNADGAEMESNTVGGNVTLNNNNGASVFGTDLSNSTIGGDVKCNGNNLGVTAATANSIAGSKSGDCAGF